MWWLLQEILGEITGSIVIAGIKRMFGRNKTIEKETSEEYIAPSVTDEDLHKLFETICKVVDCKNKLAEEVGKCSWESYKPYFSEWEHYKQLVEERGEKEAVLLELTLSLSNPLLEDRTGSDVPLTKLINIKNKLIGKVMNPRLSKEVEDLCKLQDEGQRNWIEGMVLDTVDSKVTSQITKKRYYDLVSNKLNRVMDILNQLQRMVAKYDGQE